MKLIIQTDGGSRGNPGPSAAGVVIYDENKKELERFGTFLDTQTNNYAEYMGVVIALERAVEMGADEIDFKLDSELLVKQLNREYKVKNPALAQLFLKIYNLQSKVKKVTYAHVYREDNKEADRVVNEILDERS
ncbi:ribonuclease HI family protein [Candidatus Falkowbacteria bacterium]|jgi:ribonuclease HI|nr:ribonuclease HI family protein [Candidatus Falkowbacteria bacterium]